MAKLDTTRLNLLPETDHQIDSNLGFNRVVQRLLEEVETELFPIEINGIEITVFLIGNIYLSPFPFKELEYDYTPKLLPLNIQNKIQGVISKAVSKHLPKKEPPAN